MSLTNLSLDYLIREPKTNTKNPALLVMLHGYGSNQKDLFSFANELPDELLIISVKAPLSLGFESYSWYTIHFNSTDSSKFSDIPEAKDALQKINTFIDEIVHTYKVNTTNVFILGFSQGTILSTAFALNNPNKVNHIIALSGYVNEDLLESDFHKNDFSNLDFFVSHGSVDQVIPVDWAKKTSLFLNQLNIQNTYQEYAVGHGVAPQNFHDLNTWIQKRL